MTIESAADRLAFLTALGEEKTTVFNGTTINVILNTEFVGVNPINGEVETADPELVVRVSDVSGIVHGDTLMVDSETYYVRGILKVPPDGLFLRLKLSKD